MTTSTQPVKTHVDDDVLESGDRLTSGEFMRRYNLQPNLRDVQLIDGVVVMASPVNWGKHAEPHVILTLWLGSYLVRTPGLRVGDNGTIVLGTDDAPQPDLAMAVPQHAGGQMMIDEEGQAHGAPELIVEVSSSTVSIDLHDKLDAYRRAGVKEYLVWRVRQDAVDFFNLHDGRYIQQELEDGLYKSTVFPGLWLNVPALLKQDLAAVAATVEQGIAASAHAAFAKKVAR